MLLFLIIIVYVDGKCEKTVSQKDLDETDEVLKIVEEEEKEEEEEEEKEEEEEEPVTEDQLKEKFFIMQLRN